MRTLLKKLFFQGDTWKIAYRSTESNIINDKITPFSILKMPKGFWGADPFLFKKDEKLYVFFELTDFKKRKSILACKELFNTNEKINIVYEFPFHCSYPFIFCYKDNIYILPETVQNKQVLLLKCQQFPCVWKYEKTLFSDYSSVDSTIRRFNNEMFILTYDISKKCSYDTNIFKLDDNLCPIMEPVYSTSTKLDVSRPAGNFIEISKKEYVRPVQPSNTFYGEKIVFLKGGADWKEEEITSVTIKDINLDEKKLKKYIGLHTYNKLGSVEVIDIAEMSFRPFKVFEFIFRKLNIFGYGLYDKKDKYITPKLKSKYFKKSLE